MNDDPRVRIAAEALTIDGPPRTAYRWYQASQVVAALDAYDAEHPRVPDWMEEDAWDCSKCQTRHVRGYRVRPKAGT